MNAHQTDDNALGGMRTSIDDDIRRWIRMPDWIAEGANRVFWATAGVVMLIVVWYLYVTLAHVPAVTMPTPGQVAQEIVKSRGVLWDDTIVTGREVLVGFFLAAIGGLILALALFASRIAEKLVSPLLVISQAVPKVAIAPLFLIWFGFGATTNALVAVTVAIFPIIINTMLGLASINIDYLHLGRSMGGNSVRIFWLIRLPAALPSIFAGLKLGMTLATIGAVVGELVAGQAGLGYRAQFAAGSLATTLTFASIVVLSALGVFLYYSVVVVEHIVVRGHRLEDHA